MPPSPPPPMEGTACPQCGTQLGPGLLACPACHRLRHAMELQALAGEAEQREAQGDRGAALAAWRQALQLLPASSRQHEQVLARVGRLTEPGPAPASAGKSGAGVATGMGAVGLVLWKFKVVLLFALTKAKFLLLGLTKASTLLSMLLSMGFYFTHYGWPFAVGLVLSIYVHEMGHVAALLRLGMPASAPLFVPGLGALILLRQHPASPREDAHIGLAGPRWGLYTALSCAGLFCLTGAPTLAALARTGAWINLFNLLPVWQLDGGRGFRALGRTERWAAALGLLLLWVLTREGLLLLLFLCAAVRALSRDVPAQPCRPALYEYLVLAAVLSGLCLLPTAR